ncbi:MAG: hypothetical protein CMJ58_22795 [Planctomycetaceae bacterium]|nr:hypothetical protein [Planctomycetaceae bacterium]
MNGSLTTSTNSVTRAVALLGATAALALVAGGAVVAAFPMDGWTPRLLAAGTVLMAVVIAGGMRLRRLLRPLEIIEGLLARIAAGEDDAYRLPELGIASPAAAGWSRLTQLARRWSAARELEEKVSAGLAHAMPGADKLIDALADGVAATDESGVITQANAAFAAICGAGDAPTLLGTACTAALALPEDAAGQLSAAQTRRRVAVEYAVTNGDATRTLRLTRAPRLDGDGELLGHAWTVRDVTQRRLAEDMRDKFLATATHELRTPLANIRAYAEALSTGDDIDPESQKQFFNVIESEAVRLSQLIDDLLDVSRMQAGALAIDRREVDLSRLVDDVARKVEGTMQSREIEFLCEFPPKYPKVLADKSKLAAALVNLLGNAAKYTPEGGRVTFRVEATDRKLDFSVADTGIGISPEDLPRVCERFYRCNDERVNGIPGSGLGLSLTQEIARLHGGELTVDSELNVGSIFHLSIPIEGVD